MANPIMPTDFGFNFDNSYLQLPAAFYQKQAPSPIQAPAMLVFNQALAKELGLNAATLASQGAAYLAGNKLFAGSEPIAQAYAGHQFGHFNRLGDGRAILLGEHLTPNQHRLDIQLKGAGRTGYSRSGDGRAALGPMLREYLISEAMHALGVPSTRSLCVTTSGEAVYREEALPGAILCRVAASHLRVGTFQYAAAEQNHALLISLADYTIDRHFPDLRAQAQPYLALLESVIDRQAQLLAQWMQLGFVHGVMNTDNMSICGETIDYGPCAFLNRYHADAVFSSIDKNGRYAYGNQPQMALWNLVRLAETLLALIDTNQEKAIELARASLENFNGLYDNYWLSGMRKKLGLFNAEDADQALADSLLQLMQTHQADYTHAFRALCHGAFKPSALYQAPEFRNWVGLWHARLSRQSQSGEESMQLMKSVNPTVIPRNHLVEDALQQAVYANDLSAFHALLAAISQPYVASDLNDPYQQAPQAGFDDAYKTFCGT
ncbi:MAG: hypothetical protein RL279_736 [Pseudomonadota bacterium]|jgi:uncharacterized protein YdiU (UPF0061 family)